MWGVVLQSIEQSNEDDSNTNVSDLRSKILACDLPNIKILVNNGNMELFELLRETSTRILDLRTAECASLASTILHTLNKLTKLYLWGTYMGRCELNLPDSLQCISLQKVECSSEWLYGLLITLSSLDHPVTIDIRDVVLQSIEQSNKDDSNTNVSDLRSKILSCDMPNIEILVNNCNMELFELLRETSTRILDLRTAECVSLASTILHTFNKLTKLYLWGTYMGRCELNLPDSLQCISLQKVECSSEWLYGLLITLSSLDHPVTIDIWVVVLQSIEQSNKDDSNTNVSDLRSKILSCDMPNIKISVHNCNMELFELLRETSTRILDLRTAECASLASTILHTLNKLTKLYLWGTYMGRFELNLPDSLQCISLQIVECSSEWLYGLLITLSSRDHPVIIEMWDVVLQSIEQSNKYDSNTNVSYLRSKILSCDMPNIKILVNNCNMELFELLRETSTRILNLRTAECASLASTILHTLNKLTKLYLWGTYMGRCELNLPDSLQCISLQKVECSSEWLYGLLITLSSLDHPVTIEMWDVVLQSIEQSNEGDSNTNVSYLRSKILACDMPNIEIVVVNGNMELFELLRETSTRILDLRTAECASLASTILHTFNKLTLLYLWGTYIGRCELNLPDSLQCISLQKVECSSEWLYGLLITLSSLDHPVTIDIRDVVLQSIEESNKDDSNTNVSDLRSKILSCDMPNIKILVNNGNMELFELLRETSTRILVLRTAECASLASTILHTLNKLTKLYLCGTYMGRCELNLPDSLQCISLKIVECTSEWLYGLLITLSSLDHPVTIEMWDVVLQSIEQSNKDDSNTNVSDLRSKILSCDMPNIKI
ncbi:hypothetical protein DPMN_128022 [Dreissena polymorpha]|uniref:Uncharacterized protein n=1 Tax=Dreissena polymorpha TaxID=45954 RepID=A0A9D4JX10_DREPO|nr:hypothetical protein DPMN_128022 [Dreissena polymorpha]